MTIEKRRRNVRPSRYRPRTEAQKLRRKALELARRERAAPKDHAQKEDDLLARMAQLEIALRDQGHGGVHVRRNTRPLDEITDDAERFAVLKARVERLEALWAVDRRKRETRGKIIIGGAILAELNQPKSGGACASEADSLLSQLLDVLDRRVDAIRDRLTVRDLLGDPPLPLRKGGSVDEDLDAALSIQGVAPEYDHLVHAAMGDEADLG